MIIKKMIIGPCLIALIALILMLSTSCDLETMEEEILPEEIIFSDLEEEEQPSEVSSPDEPSTAEKYYWPWISHGQLVLSSGEVIIGPDLLESDPGFIAEISEDYFFEGRLVWLVKESDPLDIEWVSLHFFVEYYEGLDRGEDIEFQFMIDQFDLKPDGTKVQEFKVELYEQQYGFETRINSIAFGRDQHSEHAEAMLNFVALDVEMKVAENY